MEEEGMSSDDAKHECSCGKGLTRRQFLTSAGAGAVVVAAAAHLGKEQEASAAVIRSGEGTRITLLINGKQFQMLVCNVAYYSDSKFLESFNAFAH
jgi:hypothetical protein